MSFRRQLSKSEQNEYLHLLETDFRLQKKDFVLSKTSWEDLSKGKINENNCDKYIAQLIHKKKQVVVKQVTEKQYRKEGSIFVKTKYSGSCEYIVEFVGGFSPKSENDDIEKSKKSNKKEKQRLLGDIRFSKHLLVFQYEVNRDAYNYLRNVKNQILVKTVIRWITNLAAALEFLKEHGIIHRNVKAKSCLITNDKKLKLADFEFGHVLPLSFP